MRIVANLPVGEPDVKLTAPSHVRGVREGNAGPKRVRDFVVVGDIRRGTARRSTGIAPSRHEPIDPRMPNPSPP